MEAVPRPGTSPALAHLLSWTAGCSLGFAAYRGLVPITLNGKLATDENPRFFAFVCGYNLVMGIALGTILTGVGILAFRRWWGDSSYPVLPGHWLLVFGLAAALADGLAIGIFRFLVPLYYPPERWLPGTVYLPQVYLAQFTISQFPDVIAVYHQAVGWGIGAVAALAFSWLLRRRLRWTWLSLFLVFFVAAATLASGHIRSLIKVNSSMTLAPIRAWCLRSAHWYARFLLIGVFTMLVALAWDVRCRSRTDWLHWAGISAWLTIAVIQCIAYCFFF